MDLRIGVGAQVGEHGQAVVPVGSLAHGREYDAAGGDPTQHQVLNIAAAEHDPLAEPQPVSGANHQPEPRANEDRDRGAEVHAEVGETREHPGAEQHQESRHRRERRRHPQRGAEHEPDLDVAHPVEPRAVERRAAEQRRRGVGPALQCLHDEEHEDRGAHRRRRQEHPPRAKTQGEDREQSRDEDEERDDGGIGDRGEAAGRERGDPEDRHRERERAAEAGYALSDPWLAPHEEERHHPHHELRDPEPDLDRHREPPLLQVPAVEAERHAGISDEPDPSSVDL